MRSVRRCWTLALICGLAISALGCSTTGTAVPEAPPQAPPPKVPRALLERCPERLPEATDSRLPPLLAARDAEVVIYHDCKQRHGRLVDAVKDRERTEWLLYCAAMARAGYTVEECAP